MKMVTYVKIIVFGANGKTGRLVVERIVEDGHEVTAFVRDAAKLSIQHENLQIVEGQATDKKAVSDAMKGKELVISCLGSDKGLKKTTVLYEMTSNIVAAMKEHHVERIIYMASAGIDNEIPGIAGKITMKLLGNVLADHHNAVAEIKKNALTYTIVRPLSLTDKPYTGKYRETITGIPDKGRSISRADVADLIIRAIADKQYENQSVAVSN